MTNQNDTQDEAERLADLYIVREFRSDSDERDELFMERTTIYKEGYRAGVASKELDVFKMLKNQVDISVKLQEENSRLKEALSAITVIQQRDAAIKELAASRAEVERLTVRLRMLESSENRRLAESEEQLTAEKARTQKLVEAAQTLHDEVILILNKGPRGWDAHLETAISDICKALSPYSTDSGDGENG